MTLSNRDVYLNPEPVKHITQPAPQGYFSSLNDYLFTCAHMPHVCFVTHTQHTASVATELLQKECTEVLSSGSLFPSPFSYPTKAPGQLDLCQATGLILQAGVGHFRFLAFLPSPLCLKPFHTSNSASTQLRVSCSRLM